MLKVAIVDDDYFFRLGIATCLEKYFDNTSIFEMAYQVHSIEDLVRFTPAILIVGICRADHKGLLSLCDQVGMFCPNVKIIVYDSDPQYLTAIEFSKGAVRGYVSKQDDGLELLRCLERVQSGEYYYNDGIREGMVSHLIGVYGRRSDYKLSKRELLIANHIGNGLRTKEIARELGLKPSTVSTFKAKIFFKLSVKNAIDLRDKLRDISNAQQQIQ